MPCSTSTVRAQGAPFAGLAALAKTAGPVSRVVSRQFRYGSTRVQLDYRFDAPGRLVTVTFSPLSEGSLSTDAVRRLLIDVQRTVAAIRLPTGASTVTGTDSGFIRVLTSAMSPDAAPPLFDVGFRVRSKLTLLTKELPRSPFQILRFRSVRLARGKRVFPTGSTIRRGTDHDLQAAVEVDRNSFGESWAMDLHDLTSALTATPSAQLLVAQRDDEPVGFAIIGCSGRRGYLQRLAVDSGAQRLGVGTALVDAATEWSARRDVRRLIVNTQTTNTNALRLYHRTGFVESPLGLMLLEHDLPPEPNP